jgi:outer membrane protein assembly factor BamB
VTLTIDAKRVLFFDGEKVICLDRKDGKEIWQSAVVGNNKPLYTYFAPCLVAAGDIALFSGGDTGSKEYHRDHGGKIYAMDMSNGKTLWDAPHAPSGYRSAEDIFVIDGMVWFGDIMNARGAGTRTEKTGTIYGHDLKTGELKVQFMPDVETHWFHHRCYRAKATEKYLLTSRTGIEFVDFRNKHWTCHHWVRGACLYGIMPANGMIYNPPHPCACYLEAKLYGFNAMAPHSTRRQKIIDVCAKTERLEKGSAYGDKVEAGAKSDTDWPMLRRDTARSGSSPAKVPVQLAPAWKARIGGRLSSPVLVNGRIFVSSIDAHEVHALQADSGKPLWRFTAGARVDSPPAIWKGRVLFGSADGYVYCLRADDGRMCWRFRAAPADLRMGSFEQIESIWPVSGSVLVFDTPKGKPELWCAVGRSMFVDSGLRLIRLNPATGELIDEKILDDKVPGTKDNLQVKLQGLNMPVALPDVLLTDGKFVYMRSQQFDFEGNRIAIETPTLQSRQQKGETAHLFCPTGLLDDVWWHRSYWLFGRVWKSGAGGYYQAGRFAPAGRPMVFDDNHVYTYGRQPKYYRWTPTMEYMLYAADKQPGSVSLDGGKKPAPRRKPGQKKKKFSAGSMPPQTIATKWKTQDVPLLARAMVLAGGKLFLAGPPDILDENETLKAFDADKTQQLLAKQAAALEGAQGSVLWAVSAKDGEKLAEHKLDFLPVFDGMIAAGERLSCCTTDGRVICLGAK